MMTKLFDKVNILSVMEYNEATKNYGRTFHSKHEGFAVLMEELAEASDEMTRLEDDAMQDLWCAIREDDAEGAKMAVEGVEKFAILLACEAIQVAAMARKMHKTIDAE